MASRKTYLGGVALVWTLGWAASAHAADAPDTEPAAAETAAVAPEKTPVPDAPAPPEFSPLKIESPNVSIRFGLLAQPQYEVIGTGDPASSGGAAQNLFLRRIRLLLGGTLLKNFEYFFDTDSPNLFKVSDTGAKAKQGVFVQDVILTYKAYDDYFKIDAGYMLPPGAHNALQGAGTLYSVNYFNNSFRHQDQFNSGGQFGAPGDVGRDAGLQLRGLLAGGHLEYRVGMFQGVRDQQPDPSEEIQAHNFFRLAGRLQINLLDPEPGFFYAGTYLGKKKVLSIGAAYDFQSDYKHWAVDAFADLPAGPGTFTAQFNAAMWDGAPPFIPGLRKQYAYMGEAGYRIDALNLSPIGHFEYRQGPLEPTAGGSLTLNSHETQYGGGLAYWAHGHNVNVKAFYTRIQPRGSQVADNTYNQFQLQWQLYFY